VKPLTILSTVWMVLTGVQVVARHQPAGDLWAGVWELDIARSTFHGPAPQREIITIAPTGPDTLAFKYSVTGVGTDGSPINVTYDGRADGKPHPHLVSGKEADQASYVRESSRRMTCQFSRSDGAIGTETITLSSDGRTFTVHQHVKGPKGEYDETHVFEKE
jgi:hypothetical protein